MTKASLAQGKQLLELFSDATSEQVQAIIEAGDLIRMMMCGAQLRLLDRQAFAGLMPFPVTVDYSKTLMEMIEAGRYRDINSSILRAKAAGRSDSEKLVIHLVRFGRYLSTEDAVTELEVMGLRPAKLEELLAFGAKYPDMQEFDSPILAIGTVLEDKPSEIAMWFEATSDDRFVPALVYTTFGRGISIQLSHGGGRWNGRQCRFAAVCVKAQPHG